MISHSKQFVFVHVPKTGGLSVAAALRGVCEPLRLLEGENYWVDVHGTARHYIKRLGKPTWDRYFTFSFVRNPFDRLVSAFTYMAAGGNNPHDKALSERYLAPFQGDFGAFVREFIAADGHKRLFHFYPQTDFLCNSKGRLQVDEVRKFEDLQAGFDDICGRIGLPRYPLGHVNPTQSRSSRDYASYYDEEMRAIVEDKYRRDLKQFGYHFGEGQ